MNDSGVYTSNRYFENFPGPSVTGCRLLAISQMRVQIEECSENNWDGYGAQSIKYKSYENARILLNNLPKSVEDPEVSIDPDGNIYFEWYKNHVQVFSVIVDSDKKIYYALLQDERREHGCEPFFDEIPKRLLEILSEFFG